MSQSLISSELMVKINRQSDFAVMTSAMEIDTEAPDGLPVLRMTGSSTIQDLQDDYMEMSALQDMTLIPENQTTWLNHSYNLPDDVFGGVFGAPTIQISKGIADLTVKTEVEVENPAAARTYNMITKKNRRFGCSVGCQVLEYDFTDTGSLIIKHVYVVEFSIVGIPANQRCWVENAIYGMFNRSLADGRGDDALKLAPAFKGLYSRDYQTILKHVEHKGLASDLSRVDGRPSPQYTLLWEPVNDIFIMKGRVDSTSKALSRDEVSTLLTKDILNTNTGGELIRQDLAEKEDDMTDKEKAVEIASDGSHDPMTGTHTHAHKAFGAQGDDGMHEHSHEHNDDANHHHAHAEKAAEPEVVKEEDVEAIKAVEPEIAKEETPEVQKEAEPAQSQDINPEHVGLLVAYNTIGKQLGFEPATFEIKKGIGNPDDLQQLITCISEADRHIDQAMQLIGIPDADGYSSPMNSYSLDVPLQKSLVDALTLKAGASISAANKDIIKAMHDHSVATHDLCKAMHPDACKCMSIGNQGTDIENARQDAEFQMGNENGSTKAYEPLVTAMGDLATVLKGLDMPAIQSQVNSAQGALEVIKKQLGEKGQELTNLSHTIASLKNAPLGRPTTLNRTTVPGEASYLSMKAAGGQTVTREDILSMTTKKNTPNGIVRHWPASVGVELRPALTDDQKSLMHPYAIMAYQDGEDVDVPTIDEMSA